MDGCRCPSKRLKSINLWHVNPLQSIFVLHRSCTKNETLYYEVKQQADAAVQKLIERHIPTIEQIICRYCVKYPGKPSSTTESQECGMECIYLHYLHMYNMYTLNSTSAKVY